MSAVSEDRGLPHQHVHHGPRHAVQSMARATVVAIFGMTFLMQPYRIPSASMEPALQVGDFLLVNKQSPAPAGHWGWLLPYRAASHGQIVIFHERRDGGTLLVKRTIAVEGDTVSLHAGRVLLNGVLQVEPYAVYSPSPRNRFRDDFPNLQNADPDVNALWWIELRRRMHNGGLTVPANQLFVMGDNRNNSQDSRYWGFVPREDVVGEPFMIYLSMREEVSGTFWQRLRHAARWRRTVTVVH